MRVYKTIATYLLILLAFTAVAAAQTAPKTINAGVLNGKAVSLPKPVYPDEAKAAKLEGMVRIKVQIDETGSVTDGELSNDPYQIFSAGMDSTPTMVTPDPVDPMLVEAARVAALETKFSPTLLSGQPVKVTGIIVYNFVASQKTNIHGGVLNGKALELPAPAYPAAARAVRASGSVSVQLVIGEDGEVISATAVSGHPLLRSAAAEAAKLAKFAPTKLEGKPVKVSGVLTYNFVLPDDGDK